MWFYAGYDDIVEALITKNVGNTNAVDENGWTPIHYLAKHGDCIALIC